MKIGILTLPLHTNYGGNLQAYALMTFLSRQGHDVILINRQKAKFKYSTSHIKEYIIRIIRKYILGKKYIYVFQELKAQQEYPILSKYTQKFIDKYIQPQTETYYTSSDLQKSFSNYNFEAIIVGSDQVWRPRYTPNIYDYYLEFTKDTQLKRISYAASFGTNEWAYDKEQTARCLQLLENFDSISVRETDAVAFIKEKTGIKATHVLDPTMLLNAKDYRNLLAPDLTQKTDLLVYILDEDKDKKSVIEDISSSLCLKVKRANVNINDFSIEISKRIAPSVESWLQGFYESEFIITDSFHACVFSILFNKPFIAYGNKNRGLSRFSSLLSMFGLEDRLITSKEEFKQINLKEKINWDRVNSKVETERDNAIKFLNNALK